MHAIGVVGLGWGDEGKGTTVDFLTRQHNAKLVVRFNGGPQAAHHVVTDDGREHCFSQFGAGTFAGAHTHLSSFVFLDPMAIVREANHLAANGVLDPFALLTIDPDAPIITPYHVAMNQLREILRGDQRHGSCGRGVGELAADIHHQQLDILGAWHLWVCPTFSPAFVVAKRIRDRFMDEVETLRVSPDSKTKPLLDKLAAQPNTWLPEMQEQLAACKLRVEQTTQVLKDRFDTVIFEGAQGVLLDEKHGFAPHTTWSNCTFNNMFTILRNAGNHSVTRVGVLRTYATRHGAGPFPTEVAGLNRLTRDDHNGWSQWQGSLRVGHLDLRLIRYALEACDGVDELTLTHLDKPSMPWPVATSYENIDALTPDDSHALSQARPRYEHPASRDALIALIETYLQKPVTITSWGASASDKITRHSYV